MKISENFVIQEFVPKRVYEIFGENSIWLIDPRIVAFCQWLRDYMQKPIIINNWHRAGQYDESGYRDPTSDTGAHFSQHRSGRAVDIKVEGHLPETIRQIVRLNYDTLIVKFGISTIEKDTPTWCHVDCRWTGLNELLEVPYK